MAAPLKLSAAQEKALGIETRTIASGRGSELRLSGEAVSPNAQTEIVAAPASGVVQSLKVELLQNVRRGTVLALLDSPEGLESQRAYLRAQGDARLAQGKLERDEALFKEGLIARARLDESRIQHQQAQTTLEQQRAMLALQGLSASALADGARLTPRVTVVARDAGSIEFQYVSVGQRVATGDPLFRLLRSGPLWLDLQASPHQRAAIQIGQRVSLNGCAQTGRVVSIGNAASSASQTFLVRAELPAGAGCASPRQYVEAAVSTDLPAVPESALVRIDGETRVFVRTPDGFEARPAASVREGEIVVKGTAGLKSLLQSGAAP